MMLGINAVLAFGVAGGRDIGTGKLDGFCKHIVNIGRVGCDFPDLAPEWQSAAKTVGLINLIKNKIRFAGGFVTKFFQYVSVNIHLHLVIIIDADFFGAGRFVINHRQRTIGKFKHIINRAEKRGIQFLVVIFQTLKIIPPQTKLFRIGKKFGGF